MKDILKKIFYWTLPAGIYDTVKLYNSEAVSYCLKNGMSLFKANARFKDLHKGKRCFIVCNGPSINKQDLLPLKGEIVFSVSNGYLHKDYSAIRPAYYCVPPIIYGKITEDDAVAWFKEIDEKIGDAELFLNYTDKKLIMENGIFKKRNVNYVCLGRGFRKNEIEIADITRIIPSVSTVPVMCLTIAMYMGFKEIYLLGVDHDSFRTGEYKYFYGRSMLAGKGAGVDADGRITDDVYTQMKGFLYAFTQYRALKKIAAHNGISIYNATAGGALDEFERVCYEDVIGKR